MGEYLNNNSNLKTIHWDKDGYKTILVNPIYAKDKPINRTLEETVRDLGANTGNLLFAEGIKENLLIEKEGWLVGRAFESVEKPAGILPSANFIIYGNDSFIKGLQRFLGEYKGPLTLAGLGAQSNSTLNTPQKLVSALSQDMIHCFQELSERAVTLGIRGEFTAECLELMGIHNYRIIGCPSAYHFSCEQIQNLKAPSLDKCQITVTTGSVYETKIVEMGYQLNAVWLMQMLTEMPEVVLRNQLPNHVQVDRALPGICLSLGELGEYMRHNAKIFFTLEDWTRFYEAAGITFSFGSRFHGNMAALRNGIPALWITHDSRTSELTKALHLPHITRDDFMKIKYPQELLEYADYTEFNAHYAAMLDNYKLFLSENHISYTIA